jgi:hypothetical protein
MEVQMEHTEGGVWGNSSYPGGGKAGLRQKSVCHAEKTGCDDLPRREQPGFNTMQENMQQWVNDVRSGHLHQCNVWFSLEVQFWPRIVIGHGIGRKVSQLKWWDLLKASCWNKQ